jgi:exopolyphosphatase/pppGpp-phosphohydrolase
MNRAIFVCGKFANLARTYGASEIIAVGTSAIREAKNQREFLEQLHEETGLNVKVITGQEEARLICRGVSSGIDIGEEKAIFIDLGGGSTEIAIGDQHKCFSLNSWVGCNQTDSKIHRRRLGWPDCNQHLQTDKAICRKQSTPIERKSPSIWRQTSMGIVWYNYKLG